MSGKLETLGVRLITGIVFVGIILAGLFSSSIVLMYVILGLFVMVGLYEYQTVTETSKYGFFLAIVHAVLGAYLFVTLSLLWGGVTNGEQARLMMLFYVFYVLFYALGEMFRRREHPIVEVAMAFWGHIYIAIPFALLMSLYMQQQPHYLYLIPIFVLVWLNDTGAYLVGSMMGKHKLIERISPKKTVEGTLGGILVSVIGGLVFYFVGYGVMSMTQWILFGVMVSVFATLGDLFESFVKREYGVKDAGWILPGHGGVLDRVDSLMVVSVAAYFFYALL